MSREITDTTNKYADQALPDGRHAFKVVSVEKRYGNKGGEFYIWTFDHESGRGQQALLPNMMAGLLRVLKCVEVEPNKFDWDTFEQTGKMFMATISHAQDKKDASKIRQHMSEYALVDSNDVPF